MPLENHFSIGRNFSSLTSWQIGRPRVLLLQKNSDGRGHLRARWVDIPFAAKLVDSS